MSVTRHTGHNSHRLYVPAVHLNYRECSLYYCGTTIWNSLPTSLTEKKSLNSFKIGYIIVVIVCMYLYVLLIYVLVQGTGENLLYS